MDGNNNETLRNVISKIRPVEIVYDPSQITKEMESMLKNLPLQPVINQIPPEKIKSIQRCQNAIDKYLYNAEDEQKGERSSQYEWIFEIRWDAAYLTAILAFGNAVTFLEM